MSHPLSDLPGIVFRMVDDQHLDVAEHVAESNERLIGALEAMKAGRLSARDDAATALHLLIGDGEGQGCLRALDADVPLVPGLFTKREPIGDTIDGLPVVLAVRANRADGIEFVTLDEFLGQEVLRCAFPDLDPAASWTVTDIVRKVRNKWGGHRDPSPPRWLQSLRYYPLADGDVITYLMWEIGKPVAYYAARALGADPPPIALEDSLAPVDLTDAFILSGGSELDCRVRFRTMPGIGLGRYPLVGVPAGVCSSRPTIIGINVNGSGHHMFMTPGLENETLDSLENKVRGGGRPNRRERRRR